MKPFVYKPRTPEQMEKRATAVQSGRPTVIMDDFKLYRPHQGDNYVRILPATWDDPDDWAYDMFVHYDIGPEKATVFCLYKMKGQPCPICQERARLETQGRSGDQGEAKALRWKYRAGVWLLDRQTDTDEAKGAQIWAMPSTLYRDIQGVSKEPRVNEWYHIDNPEEGYEISFKTVKVVVEKDKEYTNYISVALARRTTSVPQEIMQYVNEHPLPSTFIWRSYEEVKALFEGEGTPSIKSSPSEQQTTRPVVRSTTDRNEKEDPEPELPWNEEQKGEVQESSPKTEKPTEDPGKIGSVADDLRAHADRVRALTSGKDRASLYTGRK